MKFGRLIFSLCVYIHRKGRSTCELILTLLILPLYNDCSNLSRVVLSTCSVNAFFFTQVACVIATGRSTQLDYGTGMQKLSNRHAKAFTM